MVRWEVGIASQSQHPQATIHQHDDMLDEFQNVASYEDSNLRTTSTTIATTSSNNNNNKLQQAPNNYRTIISNSRIHILENASLVLRDVGKADEGFYLCQAANNFGTLSALIKLTVNGE